MSNPYVEAENGNAKKKRSKLLKELRDANRAIRAPAIYSSRSLLSEAKRDRDRILSAIRELPLAV